MVWGGGPTTFKYALNAPEPSVEVRELHGDVVGGRRPVADVDDLTRATAGPRHHPYRHGGIGRRGGWDHEVGPADEGQGEQLRDGRRQVGDAVDAVVEGEHGVDPLDPGGQRRGGQVGAGDLQDVALGALVAPPFLVPGDGEAGGVVALVAHQVDPGPRLRRQQAHEVVAALERRHVEVVSRAVAP